MDNLNQYRLAFTCSGFLAPILLNTGEITQNAELAFEEPNRSLLRQDRGCAPYQYIRELTQNSFDAIGRKRELGWEGEGVVAWDVDWTIAQSTGYYKLQITDNGTGMGARLFCKLYIS